jgi:hypothetical protein
MKVTLQRKVVSVIWQLCKYMCPASYELLESRVKVVFQYVPKFKVEVKTFHCFSLHRIASLYASFPNSCATASYLASSQVDVDRHWSSEVNLACADLHLNK